MPLVAKDKLIVQGTIRDKTDACDMAVITNASGTTRNTPAFVFFPTYCDYSLLPASCTYGYIGESDRYWYYVYACYVLYKSSGTFEALDDIALLKQIKSKRVKVVAGKDRKEVEKDVIDLDSLHPELKDESGKFIDAGNMIGFLIGVCKKLVDRIEKLEAEIANIKRERI